MDLTHAHIMHYTCTNHRTPGSSSASSGSSAGRTLPTLASAPEAPAVTVSDAATSTSTSTSTSSAAPAAAPGARREGAGSFDYARCWWPVHDLESIGARLVVMVAVK